MDTLTKALSLIIALLVVALAGSLTYTQHTIKERTKAELDAEHYKAALQASEKTLERREALRKQADTRAATAEQRLRAAEKAAEASGADLDTNTPQEVQNALCASLRCSGSDSGTGGVR